MRVEIHIREAQEADSGFISALLVEMGHPLDTETVCANLRTMKALAPRYGTFVAVIDSAVVGVVSAFASSVLHRPHAVGRISVLTVTRAFAGRGIGSALLLHAETFLRQLGCDEIQGFLFSPPVPTADFGRLLTDGYTLDLAIEKKRISAQPSRESRY